MQTSEEPSFTKVVNYLLEQKLDANRFNQALEGLLTANEKQELSHRLQIFELLSQGMPQRQVAKSLGVGIATVSRGSKALQDGMYFPTKGSN